MNRKMWYYNAHFTAFRSWFCFYALKCFHVCLCKSVQPLTQTHTHTQHTPNVSLLFSFSTWLNQTHFLFSITFRSHTISSTPFSCLFYNHWYSLPIYIIRMNKDIPRNLDDVFSPHGFLFLSLEWWWWWWLMFCLLFR